MAGYRQHSYDPNAGGEYGPPLRPFNWVQWLGVASFGVGLAIMLAYAGGKLGLLPKLLDSPTPGTAFVLISMPLINWRRQTVPLSPETIRRRSLIILAALAICALAAALVIYFKGA